MPETGGIERMIEVGERPALSRLQATQGSYIGRVTDAHRAARKHIPSYPIDNVEASVASDRDDGVYVETEHRGGGYRVHVTIADVAAHVRMGSPLADAAWQRAFTVYRPPPDGNDPLFPKALEENLSLEHNRERLGLTVSITLDAQYRPIHTSFMPVITHPDNSSYREAHERMLSDPQFQLMADIAKNVKRSYFQGHEIPLEEIFSRRTMKRVHSGEQLQAMEMVATYMLLANSCVADLFSRSGLPFLYRNFDETASDARARYSTEPVRHTALERMGLKGAYCHFTSPIRRGPDYFNGVMAHHMYHIIDVIEARLLKEWPSCNRQQLHYALWEQGAEIMKVMHRTDARARTKHSLQGMLTGIVESASAKPVDAGVMRTVVGTLEAPLLPLSKPQLQFYADHMNAVARSPKIRAIERQYEKYDVSTDRIEAVSVQGKEDLAHLSREKFSSLLQAASTTGNLPRGLFEEAMSRLKSGNYDKAVDGYTIFIQAQQPGVHRWTALKRRVAQDIKKDPSAVNGMLDRFKASLAPATLKENAILLEDAEKAGEDSERKMVRGSAALLSLRLNEDDTPVAAPFYSKGHDQRAALSHARYSFLEYYAFGQLQPVDKTMMPNGLYAELNIPGVKKRELLQQLADEAGIELSFKMTEGQGKYRMHITAHGGELITPLQVDAEEVEAEEAAHVAIRRMLRNDAFKEVVSRDEPLNSQQLHPQEALSEMVAKEKGELSFDRLTDRQQGPHRVRVNITLNGKISSFTGDGPNIDRAMRAASVRALEEFGWALEGGEETARSWVDHMRRPQAGSEKEFYVGK